MKKDGVRKKDAINGSKEESMDRKDLKIVVVYGGFSSEREVSLRSGAAVLDGLKQSGYRNVSLFDLKRENLSELLQTPMDLAFLALHGEGGEDGQIQGALDLAGILYTGSSVEASANCMNKVRAKELLSYGGVPTPRFITAFSDEVEDVSRFAKRLIDTIGLPMVLKSPCQGSSIGVVIVKCAEEIPSAIEEVFRYGDVLLAEEFVDGIEVTLPILGNSDPVALPIVEITSENEFYDYEAKYTQGMCHHIIPARISEAVQAQVSEIGRKAYRLIGCRGLARIDFILDKARGPMLIEINTLPGMTEMSLFPDSARYAGISFSELTDRIVALALNQTKKQEKI